MNASFDGSPVQLHIVSPCLVLIDPLALDGLSAELIAVASAPASGQAEKLCDLGKGGLRIGLHRIPNAVPGTYEIRLDSFMRSTAGSAEPGVFDIDTGTVVAIDLAALAEVARALTWERYDEMLQAEVGDDTVLSAINREVGGPRFAIVSSDASSPFTGDGAFCLRPDAPMLAR